jgi:integrase
VGLAGVTLHDLRHTAASLAIAAGANVKAVHGMLGYASAPMTLDVYAGMFVMTWTPSPPGLLRRSRLVMRTICGPKR